MQRIINNIQTALSQVTSTVNICGTVSVAELEKRVLTAISQLEEVQANIDHLRKAHVPVVELQVTDADELPSNESILFAWAKYCRQTHRDLTHVIVVKGRNSAEVRTDNGTKLAVFDYKSKSFK